MRYGSLTKLLVSLALPIFINFLGNDELATRTYAQTITMFVYLFSMGAIVLWVDIMVEVGRAINLFAVNSLRAAGDIYYPVTVGIIFIRRWKSASGPPSRWYNQKAASNLLTAFLVGTIGVEPMTS